MNVHAQLQADLEDAVREFPAALCEIKHQRKVVQYVICNFPGLNVGSLYDVVRRYTDTEILVESNGKGQDQHVVKSKDTATLKSGVGAWWPSWLTLRNIVTLLVALVSVSNFLMSQPFITNILGGGGGGSSASTNSTTGAAPNSTQTPPKQRTGFGIF